MKNNRNSKKWVIARIVIGQAQMVGATIGLYCLLATGVSVLTISVIAATGMVVLASKILFQFREYTISELNMRKHASEFLGTFGLRMHAFETYATGWAESRKIVCVLFSPVASTR